MPTSNPQINDPAGQAVMDAFTEAGVDPGAAYNATQGIYSMSSDKVIAELGVLRADFNAAIAELGARIDTLEATTAASIHTLEATTAASIGALEATTTARLDAVDAQIAMLTWAVIATFTIVTAFGATGIFHMWASWTRGNSGADTATSQSTER